MKRECPECARFVPAGSASCPSCGFQLETKKERAPEPADFRCEWRSGGDRCNYAGSVSDSTKGGGPWYCSDHYFAMQRESAQETGQKIVERSKEDAPNPEYGYEKRRLMALKAMAMRGAVPVVKV